MVVGSNPVISTSASDMRPVSSNGFLEIQAIIKSRFTLKQVRNMIINNILSKIKVSMLNLSMSCVS